MIQVVTTKSEHLPISEQNVVKTSHVQSILQPLSIFWKLHFPTIGVSQSGEVEMAQPIKKTIPRVIVPHFYNVNIGLCSASGGGCRFGIVDCSPLSNKNCATIPKGLYFLGVSLFSNRVI